MRERHRRTVAVGRDCFRRLAGTEIPAPDKNPLADKTCVTSLCNGVSPGAKRVQPEAVSPIQGQAKCTHDGHVAAMRALGVNRVGLSGEGWAGHDGGLESVAGSRGVGAAGAHAG